MSAGEWFIHVWNPFRKAWDSYLDPSTLTVIGGYRRSSDAFELATLLGTQHPHAQFRVATEPAARPDVHEPHARPDAYSGSDRGSMWTTETPPAAPLWDEGTLW